MATKVIILLLCVTVCLVAGSGATTTRSSTGKPTTPRSQYTYTSQRQYTYTSRRTPATTRRPSSHKYYYYMDSSTHCSSFLTNTKTFYGSDRAYVNAWTNLYSKRPLSSCAYTFYSSDQLKFDFTKLRISDCSVTVNIYRGSSTLGTPWVCWFANYMYQI